MNDPTKICSAELISLRHLARRVNFEKFSRNLHQPGPNSSRIKGRGLEFEEVRHYQFGDDIRTLDWKVTARMGKPHTKTFLEEKERAVLICIDLRNPMFFATHGLFKAVAAARLSALLAWGASLHGSRVGGILFAEEDCVELPPKQGRKAAIGVIQGLVKHPAWRQLTNSVSDARKMFVSLRRRAAPGTQIFLISDFRNLGIHAEGTLKHLALHNQVCCAFIYDRLEAELPPAGRYPIRSANSIFTIDSANRQHRQSYEQSFQSRLQHWERFCQRFGIAFRSFSSDQDPVELFAGAKV